MDLLQLVEKAEKELALLKAEAIKFAVKNNQAAGTRVRTHAQEGKNTLQDIRVLVQSAKNSKKA